MEKETRITQEDWVQIEKIVSEVVDEDAWDWCTRSYLDSIEESIEKGEDIIMSTNAGGDHFLVPLPVQAIPFAISGVKEVYVYYKKHGSLPSTAEEFISLIPSTQKEVKEFIIENFPMILSIILYGIQLM